MNSKKRFVRLLDSIITKLGGTVGRISKEGEALLDRNRKLVDSLIKQMKELRA